MSPKQLSSGITRVEGLKHPKNTSYKKGNVMEKY